MSATFDKKVWQKFEFPALLFSHLRSCILPYCDGLALQLLVYKYIKTRIQRIALTIYSLGIYSNLQPYSKNAMS